MTPLEAFNILRANLPFRPTLGQEGLLYKLSDFLFFDKEHDLFVLSGFAGTGKTSMVAAIVRTLVQSKRPFALLGPTGRAAKVVSSYTNNVAFTVHRFIYQTVTDSDGRTHFSLRQNRGKDAVIIVDEASMIGADLNVGGGNLLHDLVQFTRSGKRCKLILMGDSAQLPPVGSEMSPALDQRWLSASFGFEPDNSHELTEVVRQSEMSGILSNATRIRQAIGSNGDLPKIVTGPDVASISGAEFAEVFADDLARFGVDGVMVITRSNKRANLFNRQIRMQVLGFDDELVPNDQLMVVRNNYYWAKLNEKKKGALIANGEMVEVDYLGREQELYGFRFRDVSLRFSNNEAPGFEAKIWLDCLYSDATSISPNDLKTLQGAVRAEKALSSKTELAITLENDPFVNALQVKYGYAVTCHKAQGGQWPVVYIDQGYLTHEMIDLSFMKWLYTAITRATDKVVLVNFHPDLLE